MYQVDESCNLRYGPGKRSHIILFEWDAPRLTETHETQRLREREQEREHKRERQNERKRQVGNKRLREREREQESEKERDTDTDTDTHTHTHTHTSKRAHDRAHTSISRCPLELGEVKGHAFIFIFTFADYDCAHPQ